MSIVVLFVRLCESTAIIDMDSDFSAVEEVSQATITRCTKSKLPLLLPWHPKETIRLGTLSHSKRPENPWAENSPFDTNSLLSTPILVQREDGTQSSIKSQSTSRASETHDHMSLRLGLGIGLPFLAEVSVTGTYDKDVLENHDVSPPSTSKTFLGLAH